MSDVLIGIIAAVSGLGLGALGGYKYRKNLTETKIGRSEKFAEEQLQEVQGGGCCHCGCRCRIGYVPQKAERNHQGTNHAGTGAAAYRRGREESC